MRGGKYLMEYSKSTSNNRKGLKLTTDTNVCKVSWGFDEILVDDKIERLNRIKKREQEKKKKLLILQKNLLEQKKYVTKLVNYGYVEADEPKRK